jgi:formylglycine-generating enzyme
MMRASAAIAVGIAALAASVTIAPAVEAEPDGMVTVPPGPYTPFLKQKAPNASGGEAAAVLRVEAFRLDAEPVTNAQFLAFVTSHPQWRKSQVKAIFADAWYLRRWPSDLEPGEVAARDEPVTNVSWFAAEAYCKARGLRLPTTDQWEYALADAGRGQETVRARSLEWFAKPNGVRPPAIGEGAANGFGVKDMVGFVWEWTLDFDAYATTDSAFFCSGAAARATDPADYPAFMRYSMRESLKANYTADNLGFRCAGGAP